MMAWPVVVVGGADDGRLGHGRVVDQRRLDLGGRDPVARDVHHVVDPTEEPEVAVVVDLAAVAGEVPALVGAPVGVAVALGVAPDAAQHRRPRLGDRQVAAALGDRIARVVDHLDRDAGQRHRGRAGLGRDHARQRRDHVRAGLGLPPRVDDRAPLPADVGVVPHPRLGVDGLADRAEHAQARQVVAGRVLVAPLHERADGGRRGVELGHAVALDDRPETVASGRVGRALVDDRRGAVGQRPVDDVAVAGDPADVGRAPVDVLVGVQVEHVLVAERDLGEVAARSCA